MDESVCRKPANPALAGLVAELWVMRADRSDADGLSILPADSKTEILFSFGSDTEWQRPDGSLQGLRSHFVSGPRVGYRVMRAQGDAVHYVAASLEPGAGAALFGTEAAGLGDADAELSSLGLAGLDELSHRLEDAGGAADGGSPEGRRALDERRLDLLEAGLAAMAARIRAGAGGPYGAGARPQRDAAIDAALGKAASGRWLCPSVAAMAERLQVGYKRLERASFRFLGLGPKEILRLGRFSRARGLVERGRPVDWAAAAAELGYSDQSHLIHEFRAFSSLSPEGWRRLIGC